MANNNYVNIRCLFNEYLVTSIDSHISDWYDELLTNYTNYAELKDVDVIDDDYSFLDFIEEFGDELYDCYVNDILENVINSHNYNFYQDNEQAIYSINAYELTRCIVCFNRQIINNGEQDLYNPLLTDATESATFWNNLCYMYVKLFEDNYHYYKEHTYQRLFKRYYDRLTAKYDDIDRKLECPICNNMKGGYTGCCAPNCKTILCKECYDELNDNKCPYCRTEPMVNKGITKAIIRNTNDLYMKMYNNVMTELLVVEFGL